jgi:hypothetical protein
MGFSHGRGSKVHFVKATARVSPGSNPALVKPLNSFAGAADREQIGIATRATGPSPGK